MLTYSFSDDCDVRAADFTPDGLQTRFTAHLPQGAAPLPITLNLPGRHSVLNALAAGCGRSWGYRNPAMRAAAANKVRVGAVQGHGDLACR